MYQHKLFTRLTALFLAVIMIFGMAPRNVTALDFGDGDTSGSQKEHHTDDESVRVSIVLEDAPTIAGSYTLEGIASNAGAMEYRHRLQQIQELVVDNIETYALRGEKLDVVWNLTLVANVISANVAYGKIDEIKAMDGVVDVFVEEQIYLDVMDTADAAVPAMAGSSAMTGSSLAHAAGFTGAGSRIAIIDTGIDTDHRSFNEDAFEYSLNLLEEKGLIHKCDLDLMTAATIEGVLPELNIANMGTDAEELYVSSKLPFAYNYAEPGADVNHHKGEVSPDMEHGSHVAGIAAANTYVPDNENQGNYLYAAEAVGVCGMAPEAQILTLRVFNKIGGAYESTFMAAIEDAIILGADSINLSLGTATSGFNRSNIYTSILENLVNSGTVCIASAGNTGSWADRTQMGGYLLSKDVNFNTLGSPGSLRETLSAGSVDNSDVVQPYFTVDGQWVFYHAVETGAGPISSVSGDRMYVYLPSGAFAGADMSDGLRKAVKGNIAVCQRDGTTPLATIAGNAADAGAVAVILVNHEEGTLDVALADYHGGVPVVTLSKADGAFLKKSAQEVRQDDGTVYYRGTMTIDGKPTAEKSEYYTMSFFSSFGVPGNLSLAPDIAAPGGDILSADGSVPGGQAYVSFSGTSMAGPQIAGMSAVLAQYVRDMKFTESDYSARFLIQNLLMSTAVPFKEKESDGYYPVFRQGSGLADLDRALNAQALILMDKTATPQYNDGKVKAEFGDDSGKTGVYQYDFTIKNFSGKENAYTLSTAMFTQALKRDQFLSNGKTDDFLDTLTTPLEADATYTVGGVSVKAGDAFTVGAYQSIQVHVEIRLTNKAQLQEYPNGAYVEGYTFITGMADKEGVRDVEYSIPLIGFYGDWGDASMYDHASYVDWRYGDDTLSYIYSPAVAELRYANYFSITDPETDTDRIYIGNPYVTEDEFPEGRGAIRSTDIISGYSTVLIRSAAAAAIFLTDTAGRWIGMGDIRHQVGAASNYKGQWMTTAVVIPFERTPAYMGLQENDVFNVNVVAVPEYYETNGNISADELESLIREKKLGKGAYRSTTLTVDDTPPQILAVKKEENGDLTVTAQDNHYIAYMCITDRSGTVIYGDHVPHGTEGGKVTYTFHLQDANIGPTCVIFAGDYAANATKQYYNYNEAYPALEGMLGGYIHAGKDAYNKAWTVIDPSNMQGGGIMPVAYHSGDTVTAAAYVDGYVYQVIGSKLYTSPVNEIDNLSMLVDLERFRLHSVYALSYSAEDHMLYALTGHNTLWRIDPRNGYAEKVTQIAVSGRTDGAGRITAMAVDGKGNFYGFTYYESDSSLLVKWTLEELQKGQVDLTGEKLPGETIRERFGSMAYDAEKNVLYLAETYADNVSSSYNRLLCMDLETGTVQHVTDKLNYAVRGLFAVPASDDGDDTLRPTGTVQKLDILPQELTMFVTGQEDLSPLITPWTAENREVKWETSNGAAVTVENGIVTAVGTGTATITVSAVADPGVKDTCQITVREIPSIQMSAVVYDQNKAGYLASYNVADPTALQKQCILPSEYAFYAGGLSNGTLYTHDKYFIYTVDLDSGAVEQAMMLSYLEFAWSDAAQVPKGVANFYEVAGLYFDNLPRFGTYKRTLRSPVSNKLPFDSPAATIAYIGDDDAVASCYYILLENGALYRVSLFSNPLKYEFLGVVPGIDLTGVSKVTRGISASMWYDQATQYLVLSSRIKGERAKVQLIDPETLRVMSNTEFSEDVWYATALYQYGEDTGSVDKTGVDSTAYIWEEDPSAEQTDISSAPHEEQPVQKVTHSVYEGVEKLLSTPAAHPNGVGTQVARLESTGQNFSTLQAAIDAAHVQIVYGDHAAQTVTLLANVTESVRDVWIRNHIDYDYDLTIDLAGHTVTGNGGPVLWFEAGGLGGAKHGFHVTIKDSSGAGTGTITGGTGRLDAFSKTNGGGIYFSGSTIYDLLTVSGGNIQGNSVTGNGGAIAMSGDSAAQLVISGGVISGNTAANGAVSGRWITITGGTVTGNRASEAGGGLYLWGTGTQELQIADGARVYGNTAGVMGDDVVVVSQRGGVTYKVDLCDPAEWSSDAGNDRVAAWCVDGADGLFDSGSTDQIERYQEVYPNKLSSYTVTETGRNASPYGVAVKQAGYKEDTNLYTVTYTDGVGGAVFPNQEYTELKAGSKTPLFDKSGADPTRVGYRFIGWDPVWSAIVTTNVVYTAQWEEITAQGVILDHNALSLNEGESGVLTAEVLPDTALHQTVQWSVAPQNIVVTLTTDGNRVTLHAVGAGTATVTAQINGIKETCIVTVNHVWGEPEFDWKQVGDGYSVTATRTCGVGHTQSATVKATVKASVSPTCAESGTITYTATVTLGEQTFTRTKDVTVPATGHLYGKPMFSWSADCKTATATFACEHNPSHIEEKQAVVTGKVKKAATCTENGVTAYTATVTFEDRQYSETKDVTVPATGHLYGKPMFSWSADCKTATATFTCEHNPSHIEEKQAVVTGKVKKAATCTENGATAYTATVTFEDRQYSETKDVTVPATGHLYGKPMFSWSADCKTATATFTCEHNPSHIEEKQAAVTGKVKKAATCTENGVTAYTATVTFENRGYTEIKDVADIPMTGHHYSNYRYNHDATYWEDGTETAACDNNCGTKDTRPAKGTKLTDTKAPTATITVSGNSWSEFLHKVTFGLFYNKTQDVVIKAEDAGSGLDKVSYYLSHTQIAGEKIEELAKWTEYKSPFRIAPDNKWIIYVKVTDRLGNVGYYSSNGIVLDATAPVISGVTNGGTYYDAVTVAVREENLDTVTVNGKPVQLDGNSQFVLTGKDGAYTVIATDRAGNRSTVTVTLTARALTRIEVTRKPNKTQYLEGERLNTAGMVVTAYYNDGTSKTVTGYSVTGDTSTPGVKTVTVTYQGKTAAFTVNVIAKSVTSVAMKANPGKTNYLTGERLDLAGARITVKYNNGTSEDVDVDSSMVSGYDPNKVGRQNVTVTYGGKTTTFTVTVQSRVPASITSDVYSVSGGYISKIGAGTTVAQLLGGINEKAYCKVYQGNQEVTGSTLVGTGMEVRLLDGSTVKDSVTIVVTGDTNGDGMITITDMLAVKSHLLKKNALTGAAAKAADTSGDKVISITDFIQIKAHILGKEKLQARAC